MKLISLLILCFLCVVKLMAQSISLNGTALTSSVGSPSSCTVGGYKTLNSASVTGNCITFTTNSFQNGAIWACSAINLNQSFQVNFQINFGSNTSTGDGMAFVLQTEGVPQIIGGRAGGLGYAQGDGNGCLPTTSCPISPSVAIEFDTWDNSSSGINDLSCHHISVQKNGIMNTANAIVSPVCMNASGASVVDGTNRDVCIIWNPATPNLSVFFNGIQRVNYNGDIRSNFATPTAVYWGFTGASGGLAQTQSICGVQMYTNLSSPSCSLILPINLMYFKGEAEKGMNHLIWATATEQNNDRFELEVSYNSLSYEKIKSIQSLAENGNSIFELSYNCQVNPENAFYRLKQIDKDGNYSYSDVIYVQKALQETDISISPNPANDFIEIHGETSALRDIVLCDLYGGKSWADPIIIKQTRFIDLSLVMAGTYFLRFTFQDGEVIHKKLVVVH
jgi:hypothetical protein